MTAAAVAALTVYDMVKGLQRDVRIERVELVSKRGGRSGDYDIATDTPPISWGGCASGSPRCPTCAASSSCSSTTRKRSCPRRARPGRAEQLATVSGLLHERQTDPALAEMLRRPPDSIWSATTPRWYGSPARRREGPARPPGPRPRAGAGRLDRARRLGPGARRPATSRRSCRVWSATSGCASSTRACFERRRVLRRPARRPRPGHADRGGPHGVRPAARRAPRPGRRRRGAFAGTPARAVPDRRPAQGGRHAVLRRVGFDPAGWVLGESSHPFSRRPHAATTASPRATPRATSTASAARCTSSATASTRRSSTPRSARSPLGRGRVDEHAREPEPAVGGVRRAEHPFWRGAWPGLVEALGGAPDGLDPRAFVRALTPVRPSLIRVEADPVSYPLHIVLRFDLELAMLDGRPRRRRCARRLARRMRELLGFDVPDDRVGVLQDVHWGHAAFGYFPTYALGTVLAAQLWARSPRPARPRRRTRGRRPGAAARLAGRAHPPPGPAADAARPAFAMRSAPTSTPSRTSPSRGPAPRASSRDIAGCADRRVDHLDLGLAA